MPCPFATTIFLLYGSIGDAIALTSTAPLERIILILQTQTSSDNDKKSRGVSECYYDIVKPPHQGFQSLWVGNTYRIVHAILTRSFNDYFSKLYMNLLLDDNDNDDSHNDAHKDQELNDEQLQKLHRQKTMVEVLSIITPIIILYPLEVAIIHMMSSTSNSDSKTATTTTRKSNNNNVSDICKSIIDTSGGFANVFKGIGWTILANVQYRYSYYWLYNKFKIALRQENNQFWLTQVIWIICGIAIQPYQVIQRKLVLGNDDFGFSGLFVGIGLNSVKIFINGTVTTIYGNLTRKIRF